MKTRLLKTKNSLANMWRNKIVPFLRDPLFLSKWIETDPFSRPQGDRRTVWVNDGYRLTLGHDEYIGDVFMFVQDMYQGIMPYGRQSGSAQYSAQIEPGNHLFETLLAGALSTERHSGDLSEAVNELIEHATQSLLFYGKATYEIRCERDEAGAITELNVDLIFAPSMRKILGNYWQVITWKAARHARVKAGILRVPSENVLFIEFPKKLGGRKGLKKIVKELAFISKEVMPEFQMEAMKNQVSSGFNFSDFIWNRYLFKGRLTRNFGWNQRKVPDNDMLEYYMLYRRVRFVKSQAVLREHILMRLNEKLESPYVGMVGCITTKNLMTPEDADKELVLLRKGGLKFGELFKRTAR